MHFTEACVPVFLAAGFLLTPTSASPMFRGNSNTNANTGHEISDSFSFWPNSDSLYPAALPTLIQPQPGSVRLMPGRYVLYPSTVTPIQTEAGQESSRNAMIVEDEDDNDEGEEEAVDVDGPARMHRPLAPGFHRFGPGRGQHHYEAFPANAVPVIEEEQEPSQVKSEPMGDEQAAAVLRSLRNSN